MPDPMTAVMGVAEVKRRFSEVLSRVELRGERVRVERRGRSVAVIGPTTAREEVAARAPASPRRGLAAAAGAWEDYPDVDDFVAAVRAARDGSHDRPVEPLE